MSNSASFVVFVHKHYAVPLATHFANVHGTTTTANVTITAHTSPQPVVIEKVVQNATIMVASYSYDGIVHTDSYWSDS